MNIEEFLNKLQDNCDEIVYLCAKHMINKKFNNLADVQEIELKEFFIDYSNYDTYLNDYASVIYNRYESSKEEIYDSLCKYFNEESDNRFLFEYRLKRVINQDPKKYLFIEDEEMRNAAIYRVESKINIIENSKFYRANEKLAIDEISELKRVIALVKKTVGIE
ncbi:hypothetical protein CRV08_01400 [Halarcobacter ebronensis]|uniref:Uncharacterized protein n=1 Tax=Halarcobacter ebronensis TaxID=1462615 RepID=A0A4Q0YHV0_9BACT|nr:hypothetical protein [Halarcobacter ebronensis]RXJ70250.1 hypothetical protein CRV08_01400 [Halarcobacter ebronensis]